MSGIIDYMNPTVGMERQMICIMIHLISITWENLLFNSSNGNSRALKKYFH